MSPKLLGRLTRRARAEEARAARACGRLAATRSQLLAARSALDAAPRHLGAGSDAPCEAAEALRSRAAWALRARLEGEQRASLERRLDAALAENAQAHREALAALAARQSTAQRLEQRWTELMTGRTRARERRSTDDPPTRGARAKACDQVGGSPT